MFAMFTQELANGQYPEPGESNAQPTSLNAFRCYWYRYHEEYEVWNSPFFKSKSTYSKMLLNFRILLDVLKRIDKIILQNKLSRVAM